MSDKIQTGAEELQFLARLSQGTNRRTFLKWSGITMAVTAAGCSDDKLLRPSGAAKAPLGGPAFAHLTPVDSVTLNFSNDFGVLNYALALEQLEAAFYIQVMETPYAGMTADEAAVLDDLRKHEIIHREFLYNAIEVAGGEAIGGLIVDFTSIDFSSRTSVLEAAQAFEDLGVAAYNGAAQLIRTPIYLLLAGKIVSVEARHAAAIRDLLDPLSFAPNVFDPAFSPRTVLAEAGTLIDTEINVRGLPNDNALTTFEGR